ncbi:MAG: methyltransferase domain-containing protein [Candidatus Nitrosothermus koennekii]|nr:MAG: methyltransferase domain-containing protein [Candidatus Nitrosothermus koennekii]
MPKISGVFEHIPFDDDTFTSIMCGYSFRDAISYSKAVEEFARVLKDDGRLVIVDIGKPDNILFRLGVGSYLRFLMPILAFLVAGRLGLKFKEIYGTWKRLPKNKDMIKLLGTKFRRVEMHSMLFGGAVIFIAYK